MLKDRLQPTAAQVIKLLRAQAKAASERRPAERGKDFIQISHRTLSPDASLSRSRSRNSKEKRA
jgi:hypothetical protein